jgi:hypothetical protein
VRAEKVPEARRMHLAMQVRFGVPI